MQNDLDPKGLEAAQTAYERYGQMGDLKSQRLPAGCMEAVVAAYISATVPAGDAVEAALAAWWAADPGPTDTSYREAMIAALAASRLSQAGVSEQDIDRAAKAAFIASFPAGRHPWPWDDAEVWGKEAFDEQEWWRGIVRAALNALSGDTL